MVQVRSTSVLVKMVLFSGVASDISGVGRMVLTVKFHVTLTQWP